MSSSSSTTKGEAVSGNLPTTTASTTDHQKGKRDGDPLNGVAEELWHLRPNTSKTAEPLRSVATHLLRTLRIHVPTPKGVVVQAESYIWRVSAEAVKKKCKQMGMDGCSFRFSAAGFFEARLAAIVRFNQIVKEACNEGSNNEFFVFPQPDINAWDSQCARELKHVANLQQTYSFADCRRIQGSLSSESLTAIPASLSHRPTAALEHLSYPPGPITCVSEALKDSPLNGRRMRRKKLLPMVEQPRPLPHPEMLLAYSPLDDGYTPNRYSALLLPTDHHAPWSCTAGGVFPPYAMSAPAYSLLEGRLQSPSNSPEEDVPPKSPDDTASAASSDSTVASPPLIAGKLFAQREIRELESLRQIDIGDSEASEEESSIKTESLEYAMSSDGLDFGSPKASDIKQIEYNLRELSSNGSPSKSERAKCQQRDDRGRFLPAVATHVVRRSRKRRRRLKELREISAPQFKKLRGGEFISESNSMLINTVHHTNNSFFDLKNAMLTDTIDEAASLQ